MADWILVPCLARLRAEFDAIAPGRDRASDGTVGDAAHAGGGTSDHLPDEDFPKLRGKDADRVNEVHALDTDVNLRHSYVTMEDVVQFLLVRCRSGAETRLRYIIYNRRIWEASNSWRQQVYTGANPHTEHAHFSASYESSHEADASPWHLEDLIMTSPTPAQIAGHDIDASAGSQSWGGAAWTTLQRTGYLANTWAPATSVLLADLQARVEDQEDDLDAIGASLVLIASMLGQLTADPADTGEAHPLVAAFRYAQENPAPPA